MQQIRVELGKASYPIYIDNGSLPQLGDILKRQLPLPKVALVTNSAINDLYGDSESIGL